MNKGYFMKRLYIGLPDYRNNCQLLAHCVWIHWDRRLRDAVIKRIEYSNDVLGIKTGIYHMLFDEFPLNKGKVFNDKIRKKVIKSRPDKFGRDINKLNTRL